MTAKNEDKVSSNDIICFAFLHIDLPQVTHLGAKLHFFFEMCKICVKNRRIFVKKFCRSSLGRLSVFGRWNKARYKRGERNGNLNKQHFLCFGVLWSLLGSSLVCLWSLARGNKGGYKGREILKLVRFAHSLEDAAKPL